MARLVQVPLISPHNPNKTVAMALAPQAPTRAPDTAWIKTSGALADAPTGEP